MTELRWYRLILTLFVVLGLGSSVLWPMYEEIDEWQHYGVAYHIARTQQLPSTQVNYQADQPPFYYSVLSLPWRLVDRIKPSLIDPYQHRCSRTGTRPESCGMRRTTASCSLHISCAGSTCCAAAWRSC